MKVYIVEEMYSGEHNYEVFRKVEGAWKFVENRCKEIMVNREDCLSPCKISDRCLALVWLEEDGTFGFDEDGAYATEAEYYIYEKEAH